jgi:hypothetical protein
MEQISENYPEGFISARLQAREFRRARKHAGGGWRAAIHGTNVFAAEDGTPLATVRTLGYQLPKRDRRYSLRVEGVTFTRMHPLISTTRPIDSDIAPFETAQRAMDAGSALIERLRKEA